MLNCAKLETGSGLDITEVNVREMFASVETLIAPQDRAAGLMLVECDVPADLCVRGHPEKLRHVLPNLMTETIKFTDAAEGKRQIELSSTHTPPWHAAAHEGIHPAWAMSGARLE